MSRLHPERVFQGRPASPGLAVGVVELRTRRVDHAPAVDGGAPREELAALGAALAAAAARLEELTAADGGMGAEVLALQLALLEDPELLTPVRAAVHAGRPAAAAWAAVLDAEIADYRAAEDPYFRARAADLEDLRDRVLAALRGGADEPADDDRPDAADGAILVADDLAPSRFLETDWTRCRGVALTGGSAAGHVAMLARARGVPLLTGLAVSEPGALAAGVPAILDAEEGRLILAPSRETRARYEWRFAARRAEAELHGRYLAEPAVTAAGERVRVLLNVDDPALLDAVEPSHCDGIGLTRTEFLFHGRAAGALPDEEEQYRAYLRLLAWAGDRPVTVRTLDAGGDKPIPGLTPERDANPFLGVRGVRLSLARPEVFRVQLRALARAAARGDLRVMLPMVTVPAELEAARRLLAEAVEGLRAGGVEAAMPRLGIMVEVPAAALAVAVFDGADFYSIGSNDLVQYVMAAARDEPG
ncbi:MAG TPA: putative PEP-binding protein, partial [Geminicoccaceae bacterium]|nr:putative PEP-binding protein [Geminicoccaceae bacterium]